jgi:hypothetical protein
MLFSATIAFEEERAGEEDIKAGYRAQLRDLLEGVAKSMPCRHHGRDTKVEVGIVHENDPFSSFPISACCKEFERIVGCIATAFVFESSGGGPPIYYPPIP